MSITLAEYRAIKGGLVTLAEIEARHKSAAREVAQNVLPAKHPDLPTDEPQVAQIVQPAADGWAGELPFPPSLNRYYRHVGAKVLIAKRGRQYRKAVEGMLKGCQQIGGKVMLMVDVYPPDLRRRDLDNLLKGLQDSLTHAGLLADDSDIDKLVMVRHAPCRPAGKVRVSVRPYFGIV